jgi:hypothetical protein
MSNEEETTRIQSLAQDLRGPFNLSIDRKSETLYFHMQTEFVHMDFNGKRTDTETYFLTLRCIPAVSLRKKHDQYTCGEFYLRLNSEDFVTIPALRLWNYEFDPMSGLDGKGPVFGVPHNRFESIKDSRGNELSPDIRYAIYNNFIDFHALNDGFSRPMFGRGIEQLKLVGDRIVHPAAFTEAPVNLGTAVNPGSVFRNGEVTLELKGISVVDGVLCALIGYDSGESTLKMIMASTEGADVLTEGGSEYKGDIYIDFGTGWVRKVTLDEFVITETGAANSEAKVNRYTVRHLLLRLISQEEFENEVVLCV